MSQEPRVKKVAIVYGWAEGPAIGKKLASKLTEAGFDIAKNPKEADIIIAHSGGYLLLPPNLRARLAVLIDPPICSEVDMRARQKKLLIQTCLRPKYWKIRVLNLLYIFLRKNHQNNLRKLYPDYSFSDKENFVIVRNSNDQFLSAKEATTLSAQLNARLVELPGDHEDVWINPSPYVNLLKSLSEISS